MLLCFRCIDQSTVVRVDLITRFILIHSLLYICMMHSTMLMVMVRNSAVHILYYTCKTFAPCYSQSTPPADFTPPSGFLDLRFPEQQLKIGGAWLCLHYLVVYL
jgi:hypothetical protein